MNIASERRDGIEFVTVTGRIDAHTLPQFQAALTDAAEGAEHGVVVDFRGVSYISSAGLRAILVGMKAANTRKRELALYGLSESVNEVFNITGFDRIVPVVKTEAEAIEVVMG